jgi:hypothetical protein
MIRRVLRYFTILGSAGLLAAVSVMASPLIWPRDPDSSLVVRDGRFVGEVVGYIWGVDFDEATIQVSASVLGLYTFPVAVSSATRITEGEKEGAFADLGRLRRVRVVYEARDDGRVARSIELLRAGTPAGPPTAVADRPGVEYAPSDGYWVEVGVFAETEAEAATALLTRLLEQNQAVSMETVTARDGHTRRLRVQVGPFPDGAAASAAQQNLRTIGYQAQLLW